MRVDELESKCRELARRFSVLAPVRAAAEHDLPVCDFCGAWKGDPCRRPNGMATYPHRARLRILAQKSVFGSEL